MKKVLRKVVVAFAAAGMIVPVQTLAETQKTTEKTTAPVVTDVALTTGGTLSGAVVSPEGQPLSGAKVQVLHQGKVVAATKTSEDGKYSVKGLRNGLHVVKTGQVSSNYRFWNEKTAPPSARKGAVLVPTTVIQRGQLGGTELTSVLVPAGVFGAALATTLATTLDNEDKPASP